VKASEGGLLPLGAFSFFILKRIFIFGKQSSEVGFYRKNSKSSAIAHIQ
jgi:hypothetical protein